MSQIRELVRRTGAALERKNPKYAKDFKGRFNPHRNQMWWAMEIMSSCVPDSWVNPELDAWWEYNNDLFEVIIKAESVPVLKTWPENKDKWQHGGATYVITIESKRIDSKDVPSRRKFAVPQDDSKWLSDRILGLYYAQIYPEG